MVLELMGHRRLFGYLSEVEVAGSSFLRIDMPTNSDGEQVTQLYSPSAVYAITPTSDEIVQSMAPANSPKPVCRFELPLEEKTSDPDSEEFVEDGEGPF